VAEQADAMVSKTIGGQPSCRFDPDLRQNKLIAELCNGSTADFESVCQGSNPCSAANQFLSVPLFSNHILENINEAIALHLELTEDGCKSVERGEVVKVPL
jgi:hypothetical protein